MADGPEFVPENVKQFLTHFRGYVKDNNVPGILSMYETQWPRLTEKYYQQQPWPSPEIVQAQLPETDEVFMVLYKELYYRHINTRLQPSLAQRVYAWENYSDLFYHLLGATTPNLELPVQWLWEIIEEFIYQYESWCQYVNKLGDKVRPAAAAPLLAATCDGGRAPVASEIVASSEAACARRLVSDHFCHPSVRALPPLQSDEEIQYLKENSTIWNVTSVIGYLEYLKSKSNIIAWLERGGERGLVGGTEEAATTTADGEYDFSSSETYRMLGYFCIIGQLRLHCLFRDYHLALKEISAIELSGQGLYARIPECHVNLYYFMGFTCECTAVRNQ